MRYSPFPAVIALPLLLLAAFPTWAGPITYQLDDYPASQGGFHIAGAITTDGTTGIITKSNVLSWSFTINDPNNVFVVSANSTDSGAITFIQGLIASETSLLAPVGFAEILSGDAGNTAYEVQVPITFGSVRGIDLWIGTVSDPFTYAEATTAVPEPATLTLVLVGIGGLVGARLARRRRAAASRQAKLFP
jgi:hypothetical protein